MAENWLWTGGSSTGQVVKTYTLGGRTIAVKRGGEWTYLFPDHIGSPALEADYDANPGFRWKYEPYGTMRASEWTLPIDRGFTGQVIEPGLGLHDYDARHYAQPLGRWIAPDTVVPDPADPQSLNRYSYVLNRPTVLVDPSGHSACALPHPGIAAGCWVIEKIALYGPQIINLIQQLTIAAPQAPAVVDLAIQAGQASQPASSNAGNTADPGGLDPNNWDPNRWGTNYRANYEQYYGVERDSAYQVHHVLPQRFQDILSKASQGRINVDDPRWLREVLKNDSTTGTAVHQRLYTDVWQNWAQQLGRDPTAQEIIQFARQLEAQYATQGTLFYREGAHLAGRIDWNTLLQLLQGG